MIIDLTDLMIGNIDVLKIDDDITIDNGYLEGTSIRELIGTHFYGEITRIGDEYQLTGNVSGIMVLPDDVTLSNVDYSYNIAISEDFSDNSSDILKIIQNKLDITDFLWQNILVEVPSKVRNDDTKDIILKGDGWRLITEDELDNDNDSPFSELSNMFDSRKE